MAELKLNVAFAFFPYGGNGGTSSEHPAIRSWMTRTAMHCAGDSRINERYTKDFSDTPITMTRNKAVLWARSVKADVLIMVDSDMIPDVELGEDPTAKPFFATSFDFLHRQYPFGPVTVCAPYCGVPPHENVYVFHWSLTGNADNVDAGLKLAQYNREHAELLTGIQPIAAAPTGLIMYDMRCFDLVTPDKNGWFYYEWTDLYASEKASTEDVTQTRDLTMAGRLLLKRDVVYCNWDAWAGHVKPKVVRKPRSIKTDQVAQRYTDAVLRNVKSGERMINVDADWGTAEEWNGTTEETGLGSGGHATRPDERPEQPDGGQQPAPHGTDRGDVQGV
jgi:hypothetical protein